MVYYTQIQNLFEATDRTHDKLRHSNTIFLVYNSEKFLMPSGFHTPEISSDECSS
jgi:hypothetical protein